MFTNIQRLVTEAWKKINLKWKGASLNYRGQRTPAASKAHSARTAFTRLQQRTGFKTNVERFDGDPVFRERETARGHGREFWVAKDQLAMGEKKEEHIGYYERREKHRNQWRLVGASDSGNWRDTFNANKPAWEENKRKQSSASSSK